MPISADAKLYIISKFETQKQIDDYIELLDKLYLIGQPYQTDFYRLYLYAPFIGADDAEDFEASNFVDSSNYWHDSALRKLQVLPYSELPIAEYIIRPDEDDELWVSLKDRAISQTLHRLGSRNANASKKEIADFLKKYGFNKDVTEQNLDTVIGKAAYQEYFRSTKNGIGAGPLRSNVAGGGFSLFGSWESLGVFKDAVKTRLKSFNVQTKTFEENIESFDPNTGDVYEERIQILEEFLQNTSLAYTYNGSAHRSWTFGLFNKYREKNNLPTIMEDTNDNTDPYSTFIKILAPIKDNAFTDLSSKFQETLFSKIENSGLLDLLTYVDHIRQFGRDRLKNEESVKASAAQIVNRS